MLAVAERAVSDGTMTSAARLGRQSDDLRATAAALTTLGLQDSRLGRLVRAQLARERREGGDAAGHPGGEARTDAIFMGG